MAEPAELLLIKDQYGLALHSLSRGLAAEEAGNREEALVYYRKGQLHLTQGLEVPTGGERHNGAVWDTARQLQQGIRDTLRTVNTHLSDLEVSQLTVVDQRGTLLKDLPPNLYPDLEPNSQPLHSSLHHLYPSIPATTQNTTPTPHMAPVSPASPAVLHTHSLPAAAPGTIAMANPGDQPPAYTPQPTDGHRSVGYGLAGGSFGSRKQTGAAGGEDGNELLSIPSGVQLFFVAPNGQVSSLSYPGYLRIIAFDSQHKDSTAERPTAFLHVCDWLYPLTSNTPVLLANSGIFMFPDPLAETPGSYAGIVLSSELPAADRETFQDLLSQIAELRIQGPEGAESEVLNLSAKVPLGPLKEQTGSTTWEKEKRPLPGWSEKMAQGILSGATLLSQSLAKGAEATGKAIHKGAAKIRDHITPEETPSEVSPQVARSLQVAKTATSGAVRVSQFLVNGVSTVAGHVADKVAPHVKKHGAKLVPESLKKTQDGRPSNFDGAKFVAVSSVQGFSTIWTSLETGAKLVGKSVTSATVTTVKYKYGDNAGQATDTALRSVTNVGVTAYNIDNLGIKAILKTFGKKTGKAIIKSPEESDGKEVQKGEPQAEIEGKEVQEKEDEEKKK
ncbi:spartin a isoform X2 [Embiotoca jacksoni]|uniref:spartin a isoform X2 n=1 Tax=Embiotoca jacksoni TaxID=100190 RepID=UPI0037045C66